MHIVFELFFKYFLVDIIFGYVLSIPGAGVKWVYYQFLDKEISYEECFKTNASLNVLLGVLLTTVVAAGYVFL